MLQLGEGRHERYETTGTSLWRQEGRRHRQEQQERQALTGADGRRQEQKVRKSAGARCKCNRQPPTANRKEPRGGRLGIQFVGPWPNVTLTPKKIPSPPQTWDSLYSNSATIRRSHALSHALNQQPAVTRVSDPSADIALYDLERNSPRLASHTALSPGRCGAVQYHRPAVHCQQHPEPPQLTPKFTNNSTGVQASPKPGLAWPGLSPIPILLSPSSVRPVVRHPSIWTNSVTDPTSTAPTHAQTRVHVCAHKQKTSLDCPAASTSTESRVCTALSRPSIPKHVAEQHVLTSSTVPCRVMPVQSKPIPALYTVYILRSTVRHASLYIGSTPNPPRRLKQHNGEARGGAVRTSRLSLRPWEMVGLVSGFPGMVAALKFEWALTNPHLSLHIPSTSRITVSNGVKKNGRPRRPRASLSSILSNLQLLLGVPSFRRWPLTLHFFAKDVHKAWVSSSAKSTEPLRNTLNIVTDFGPDPAASSDDVAWGIDALPVDYTHMKPYIEKAQSIITFEREGSCVVCKEALPHGQGLHAVCPNESCEAVGHLSCWSRHMLHHEEDREVVVPIQGRCPQCGGHIQWVDMMKELSLRERGAKEVEALLKVKKRRTKT
ncbi:GIY-YIG catalytic domain-containing protein [Colletotrichum cuscutae]|uniref:GIY-YIG catalytic domain-containing protein n=1 Tax=Colletotrichum cuscutae TaxID=1209917 RepID=A0AAI9TVP6_9PEZI|nr:GIY-YIG catalytic domain-containing protein [Colletotrichum cuscutae]